MDKSVFDKYIREMMQMHETALKKNPSLRQNTVPAAAPAESIEMPEQNPNLSGKGRLLVNVTSARELFPIKNALVTIFTGPVESMTKIAEGNTDESGKTQLFELPAPPGALADDPENQTRPYAFYNILTRADGYLDNINYNATVFDSVTSIQNVNLVPKYAAGTEQGPIVSDEFEEYTL